MQLLSRTRRNPPSLSTHGIRTRREGPMCPGSSMTVAKPSISAVASIQAGPARRTMSNGSRASSRDLPIRSGELWGAANALSHALSPKHPRGATRSIFGGRTGRKTRLDTVAQAAAAADTPVRKQLDYQPKLTLLQRFMSIGFGLFLCLAVYKVIPAAALGWPVYACLLALLFCACKAITMLMIERQYQDLMTVERNLGDADSSFASILGLDVHYKKKVGKWRLAVPSAIPKCLIHCYHGFGANTFSWALCQSSLADKVDGIVTAHDTPGFGLTERPKSLDAYTTAFTGQIGRSIFDQHEAEIREVSGGDCLEGPDRPLRVLIGHSMGGAAVAEEVLARPEALDCVILVSPAIIAFSSKIPEESGQLPLWRKCLLWLSNLASVVGASVVGLVLLMLQPVLVWVLRVLVRSRTFWEKGLRSAFYDGTGVTAEIVDAYRMPQLVRGWEAGMLRFVRAKVVGGEPALTRLRGSMEPAKLLSTAERFAGVVRKHNIRVLLLHGQEDVLVPVSNSRRLASMLGSCGNLIEIPQCGHQPQEEMPERFVEWVSAFLKGKEGGV